MVLLIGTYFLLKGLLSVGTLVAFVSYNKYLYDLMSFFTALTQIVEPSLVSLDRINNILDMKEVYIVKSPKKVKLPDNYPYAFEIKDLDFKFNNIKVFHKLNLVIKKNTFTAIYGESGVGKTTLLNLLFKLYEVQNGKIFIFGKDINEFSLEEIFGIMSCVPQEPKFFTDTPLNNLKIFHPSLKEEGLKFLIDNLGVEDKFYYFISKEGEAKLLDLSGGERKLLGIIRGLLFNTPIWILDEPTAFLDKMRAKKILEFLKYNSKNKTIIVFSHDPIVREFADEIIEIKKEEIYEQN
jgi:ABC-type multidrug transport system fused ATPase/permease subunit